MKIHITAKPNSHATEVIFIRDNYYRVTVTEPASQNKANQAIIEALADHFQVAKSLITITHGQRSKSKTVDINTDQKLNF